MIFFSVAMLPPDSPPAPMQTWHDFSQWKWILKFTSGWYLGEKWKMAGARKMAHRGKVRKCSEKFSTVDIFTELLLLVVLSLFFCDHCLFFQVNRQRRALAPNKTTTQLFSWTWLSERVVSCGGRARTPEEWAENEGNKTGREISERTSFEFRPSKKKRNGTLRAEIPHTMTYTIIERRSKCAGWHFSAERSGGGCHWKIGWRSDLIILVRARDSRRRERDRSITIGTRMLGLDIDFSNTEDWWRIKVFASDVRDGTTTTTKTHQKTMSCCDAATWRNLVLLHDMATWINHFDTCTMHLLLAVGSLPRVQQSRTCTRIVCLIWGKRN